MTALWLMGAAALALLLRHFVCVLALVQGKSMRDSLRGGELLFALRRGPAGRIRRFDVVLCRYPGRKELFVKRVAALPASASPLRRGALLIDGAPVEENFALAPVAPQSVRARARRGRILCARRQSPLLARQPQRRADSR